MDKIQIIAQIFGILGFIVIVASFQFKDNKRFFIFQGLGSLFFFLNFIMIGAIAGAFFNFTNFIRGILFMKDREKKWKLICVNSLYTACFLFAMFGTKGDFFQIILSAIPYVALMFMSICMYKGNATNIRISQIVYMSPAWIIHNIFNFTLGGILCESFNIISSIISLIKIKKNIE